MPIDMIVLHAISLPAGEFELGHIERLFMGALDPAVHPSFSDLQGLSGSAHVVVDR